MADQEKQIAFKINIEGVSNEANELAKLEFQLKNLRKEKSDLIALSVKEGFQSNENRARQAAYTKEIWAQEAALKTLKRVVDSASDSLNRKIALLAKLTAESKSGSQAVADKLAPAIKKLNDEIKAGEQARGVFTRNVGNYPGMTQAAAGGFRELSGAVGGVHGQIGSVIADFAEAKGPAGILTVAIAALAMAWKRTAENVKLYFESADKLKYGFAGYEQDAEKARIDARRRAQGQITAGNEAAMMASNIIGFSGSTDEQKAQAQLMRESARLMQIEGKAFLDQVTGVKDKFTWTLKYNALLQEEEKIHKEKLAKETEWEALEAQLVKQRVIISDQESTSLQKKEAAIEAEKIANQLVKEKTSFIDRQLNIATSISDMTNKQEVAEDRINGLLKEKNTVQKEYESDMVKVNRLENTSNKGHEVKLDLLKAGTDEWDKQVDLIADAIVKEARLVDLTKEEFEELGKKVSSIVALIESIEQSDIFRKVPGNVKKGSKEEENLDPETQALRDSLPTYEEVMEQRKQIHNKVVGDQVEADKKHRDLEMSYIQAGVEAAGMAANTIFNIKNNNLDAQMKLELSNKNLTEVQKAAIEKKYAKEKQKNAIIQAIINGALGITSSLTGLPIVKWIEVALVAAATIAEVALIKSQKFASGGFTRPGSKYEAAGIVHAGEWVAPQEMVRSRTTGPIISALERQRVSFGGSGLMNRNGYASGGFVDNSLPNIPSPGIDYDRIINGINNKYVILDVNKLNSAQSELQVINQSQRI